MFKDNKYTRIYYQLINKRQADILLKENVYCETHHIIPKSLGGDNQPSNLVNLLPREHFMAHLLLTKMVKSSDDMVKMYWALHKMCYSNVDYFNSRDYEWYRHRHNNFMKDNHHSRRIPGWNQKMRELVTANWENNIERKQKTSNNMKKLWHERGDEMRESLLEHNRKIAKKGAEAAKKVLAKKILYNGKVYLGWKQLMEETGVSKHLYKKYYLHGIDPCDRIGKNGPVPK